MQPSEYLKAKLRAKGWTQDELASVLGRSRQNIIDVLSGKTGITADMAIALSAAFGEPAEVWLKLDLDYRLSKAKENPEPIAIRADLYHRFPIKDMQRRGWINAKSEEVESELKRFFAVTSLDVTPEFQVCTRKAAGTDDLSPAQRAWCFRARQLAAALAVSAFHKDKLASLRDKLRACAAYLQSAIQLPKLLSQAGIRFVIVEPFPGAKIDGAAFWLDENSPVIAVSLRYDRVDWFWFTVMHEFAHIESEDSLSVDTDLAGEDSLPTEAKTDIERKADARAAASLVPPAELDSFVRRVGPLYSKERIVQFAHRIKMHPGIIVGQLQHLGEIGYSANRELLAKIRKAITEVALTDGWGKTVGTI